MYWYTQNFVLSSGLEVVRLLVAHCTLNPIEMAWAQVKGHIKGNAKHFNLTETKQLAWDEFAVVTPDCMKKLIRHVSEKVEDHYWSCDGLYLQCTQCFIIQFGEGDCDSDGGTLGEETCTSDDGSSKQEIPCGCDSVTDSFFNNGFSKSQTAFVKTTTFALDVYQ